MMIYLLFSLLGVLVLGSAFSRNSAPEASSEDPAPTAFNNDKEPPQPSVGPTDVIVPVDPDPEEPGQPTDPVDPAPDPDPAPTDPTPDPAPNPNTGSPDPQPTDPTPPAPGNPDPTAPEQLTDTSNGGGVAATQLSNGVDVAGGRVTTLRLDNADSIDSVRITGQPAYGHLSVNPDNTLALVMSGEDYSGQMSFSYEVTYQDGTTQSFRNTVDVLQPTQGAGWAQGNVYMLETDANGDVIVETGDNHRAVYISGSDDALSLSDIAALEGLDVNQITADWLQAHPDYGSVPDMALDSEAGMRLWYGMTGSGNAPSSDWLLFERGFEYDNLGAVIDDGTMGEDPMHPVHITAYGDGAKPVLNTSISLSPWGGGNENIVVSDLFVTGGVYALSGTNLMLDNVDITNTTVTHDNVMGLSVQHATGFTLHNSAITDVYRTVHPDGAAYWPGGGLMTSGGFIGNNDNVLIEGSLFDHNGWAPDYEFDQSTDGGQSPTMFNHNFYINRNNTDVTFRDNITMRGSLFGSHIRSGGFVEDNVFLDNNAAVDFFGGNFQGDGFVGHYTLFSNNLITSGGYKDTASGVGYQSFGIGNSGMDTTLLDNIIAHAADPNNPEELSEKIGGHYPIFNEETPFYNDTIIYNWLGGGNGPWLNNPNFNDQNVDGLDTSVLNATTIQIFTQQLLGDPNAGIPELAAFLRAQANGSLDDYVDADLIIDFFQVGFGLSPGDRISPETLRFIPNDLGDGIRWDNRINWSTDDLPGSVVGDSVDLGGNMVNYGGTTTVANFDFGSDGTLNVTHGRLNIEGVTQAGANGGQFDISNVGQVWMNGYSDQDRLTIDVDGGRFVNTGTVDGNVQMNISNGQTVLATDGATYDVEAGSSLNIDGSAASVGFDGSQGDAGVLRLDDGATLSFDADAGGFSTIEEFRTGAMGDNPDIASGVNLGLGTLELDVAGLAAGTYELISVDELVGELSDIRLIGLSGNQDAHLVIDYATDTLTVQLTAPGSGSGAASLSTVGTETDMDSPEAAALWEALTAGHETLSDDLPTEIYSNDLLIAEAAA